jgi:hypothetical protein
MIFYLPLGFTSFIFNLWTVDCGLSTVISQ